MSSAQSDGSYVLVEGKNDEHVIRNLCTRHGIKINVISPKGNGQATSGELSGGGIAVMLARVSARLKEPGLDTLGVVVDADLDIVARWAALRDRLTTNGYQSVPTVPSIEGWISTDPQLRRVGIWLMPNNQLPGILEDFVWTLIPVEDPLRLKAAAITQEIEQESLNHYASAQHSKAMIHTWLAWQEIPGPPMGLAITAQTLRHDTPAALAFVAWLRRLFDTPLTSEVV